MEYFSDEKLYIEANKEDMSKSDVDETEAFEEEINKDPKDIFAGVDIDNTVKVYIKEISVNKKLSQEQTKALLEKKNIAQKILAKNKLPITLPIADKTILSKIKKDKDVKAVKSGELAANRLIECNLKLVVHVAKRYMGHGIGLLDLIQEGSIGLMKGIEKFDTKKSVKLSTYITWWIRHYISCYLTNQSRDIRIPSNVVQQIFKLNKIKAEYYKEHNKEISNKQLAKKMGMTEDKVVNLSLIPMNTLSIDAPVGENEEGEETTLGDYIPDNSYKTQEELLEGMSIRDELNNIIKKLEPNEKEVIQLRYGLTDDIPKTLEEVGEILGYTRERVRQLEDKALRKLKHFSKGTGLIDFTNF